PIRILSILSIHVTPSGKGASYFWIGIDLRLRGRPWGFRLAEARTPVVMQHSRTDDNVPFALAERTARMLPDCRLVVRESGPHFSPALLSAS
ncbi:MAG: hypothetical protein MUF84_17100, partial [Anaerolineae bacterium]|nr:hypothetical protein [Anaerolineae bacterium]